MVTKVKIFGAGSVGNHLAQACRRAGWDVTVADTDSAALERMKNDIYPSRYGIWDDAIALLTPDAAPIGEFDVIFIGTPPDTHLAIAVTVLNTEAPRVLQIEKPLCAATLEGLDLFLDTVKKHPETKVIVGYDHILGKNTKKTEELLRINSIGKPLAIDAETRSHWSGIFKAHPWLAGPQDTYLGYWERGGGALGEHSHALNLWQHLAHTVGAGKITRVQAMFDYVRENGSSYDKIAFLTLETATGLTGRVVQDVITLPKKKYASVQGESGRIEWHCDLTKTLDRVTLLTKENEQSFDFAKTRPDEFFEEILHIRDLLNNGAAVYKDSPIRLERAVETMRVINAAHRSHAEKRSVEIAHI